MKPPSTRAFGLLTALIALGFVVTLLAAVVVEMAGLVDKSAGFAWNVRSRALAESGIEFALGRLATDHNANVARDITLAGGTCSVKTVRSGDPVHLVSVGRLALAGEEIVTTIDLTLKATPGGTLAIGSRTESTRHVRTARPAR